MKTPILKVFLSLAFLALSGWCYASANIVINNYSNALSLFVISDCTINTNTNDPGQGGFFNSYYISPRVANYTNSLTWSVPSSNCMMEIPGINSYLYFDSTGVSQDGSYASSSTSKSIKYLVQYPTSSSSTVPTTAMTTTYTHNYNVTYSTSYSSSPTVTFNFY